MNDTNSIGIGGLLWFFITLIAIYYSFIISGGFKWGPFLLALIFSPFYLVYGIYLAGIPPKPKLT